MYEKVKEFMKKNWYKILMVFMVLLVYVVSISIAIDKDIPNNANDIKSDLISLSSYNNEVVNLASPDLEDKEYLGDGNYLLFTERGLTLSYNVFTGIFTREGQLIGTSFEYPLIFNLQGNQALTVTSYIINESSSHTQIWEKPNKHLLDITNNSFTFTTSSQFQYIFLNFNEIDLLDLEMFKLQIEVGDTASDYKLPVQPLVEHGFNDGYWEGYDVGHGVGSDTGFQEGYDSGYDYGHYSGFNEGWDEGHDKGYIMGANDNFDSAYDKGLDEGKRVGELEGFEKGRLQYSYYSNGKYYTGLQAYNLGFNDSPSNNFGSMITSILLGVGTVLGIELLPNITIGAIIAVPIVFGIIAFVLGKKKE